VELAVPIVQAPMAGGPSTPALAAAVSEAGALGFVAAGYKTPEAFAEDVAATRALTASPFGVNVFAAAPTEVPEAELSRYASSICEAGLETGAPRSDDDAFAAKVDLLIEDPVAVVSFVFGCPDAELIGRLKQAGSEVWITITDAAEARAAAEAGADAVIAQGVEAGGHRGSWTDEHPGDLGLLALLQLVTAEVQLPVVASGGIATGRAVAAVLCAGAAAAQVGTVLMRTPEAATAQVHREALAAPGRTALTRAFTGRTARGIVNRFLTEHDADAPAAYPAVHFMTAPLRRHGRETGDPDLVNLWAGQAHELAPDAPAAEVVERLWADARAAAGALSRRLS
jgi:nitronate monooxygenase